MKKMLLASLNGSVISSMISSGFGLSRWGLYKVGSERNTSQQTTCRAIVRHLADGLWLFKSAFGTLDIWFKYGV